MGYELQRVEPDPVAARGRHPTPMPPAIDPIWPLPRGAEGGASDAEIRAQFERFEHWHYAFAFEGGLSFAAHHRGSAELTDLPERPLQRFRHFMPWLLDAEAGTLEGKRVLDIGCNSGFWSIQCALLGAEVVGFDARSELIEQAELVRSIVGVDNARFEVLDFWDMSPESLGGTFDIVLNLGLLYHLAKPLEALERTRSMARRLVLLDTGVYRSANPTIHVRWEEPFDIRMAHAAGIVATPSKRSVELMLRHLGCADWLELPIRSRDMPADYLRGGRASWLIRV